MNESKLLKVSYISKIFTKFFVQEIIDENEKIRLENLDFELICSNWISINQFLSDWFIKKIRPEAIDMNLCLASLDGSDTDKDVFELKSDPEVTVMKHQKPSSRNDSKSWTFENWYGKFESIPLANIG